MVSARVRDESDLTSRNASDSSASITHSERTPFGTWLTLGLICGIGLFNYIDRTVLAAVIPLIKVEFDLTDTSIGMLSGAFALLYAICGVPLGRLADNYSRRSIIGAAAAFWSAMTAACGLATGYWTLFFSRIGVAFGEAAFLPSAYSVISDLFSPARRHLAFGILSVFCSLGVVAGLAIGGGLAVAFGWRIAFILLGLPGLVFAALVFFLTKEPVRGGNDGGDSSEHEKHSLLSAIKALSRERVFMWIVSTSGFNGFCMLGMVQWLPSFFQRTHQLSIETIGLLFGVAFGVGMALGQFTGGLVATRLAAKGIFEPLRICILTNFLIIPGFLALLWTSHASIAVTMTFVTTFIGAFGHPAQSAGAQNSVSPRLRGTAAGFLSLAVALIGMGIGPVFVGVLSDAFLESVGSTEALRRALSIAQVLFLFASYSGWRAYRAGIARSH